jgi:L-asparaginase
MSSIDLKATQSPHILVLGMGGTIAGLAQEPKNKPLQYQAGQVSISNLLGQIQEAIPKGLTLISEQLVNINSKDLSESVLTQLALTVLSSLNNQAVQGIVITHGTDTIEETGLFLQLTCGKAAQTLGKRVVLTGAMLPGNAPAADGPSNLLNAVQWASTLLENCPGGVYGVFAGKVCMAKDLAKRHGTAPNAPLMDSPTSPLNLINPSWLAGVRAAESAWREDLPVPHTDEWPWVEILTSHAGARPQTISQWLGSGVKGLVLAGSGMGGFHESWKTPLDRALASGIALVRASRTGAGLVRSDIPEKDPIGCMAAGSLSSPRARIALQLALNAAKQANLVGKPLTWQDFFARIADLPEIR